VLIRVASLLVMSVLPASYTFASFDEFENWGFDQGGGLRQGNFTGDDSKIVVLDTAWNQSTGQLAIAGTLNERWAVRVYQIGEIGPSLLASWDGGEDAAYSVVSAVTWGGSSGRLVCGVEEMRGNETVVKLSLFDPEDLSFRSSLNMPGWVAIAAIEINPQRPSEILAVGRTKHQGQCRVINQGSMQISVGGFMFELINEPQSIVVAGDLMWVAGQKGNICTVELYESGKQIGNIQTEQPFSLYDMKGSADGVYLTGRSTRRAEELENFSLRFIKKNGNSIESSWSVRTKDLEAGREWGAALLPVEDGGVLVGGNFHASWLLGQSDPFAKLAMLPASSEEMQNFDSFLARYDADGNLLWSQTSGYFGNDFIVGLVGQDAQSTLVLGNRKVGGSFGPFLTKVRISGNPAKNNNLVELDPSENKEFNSFSWQLPSTLRFAEPMEQSYFSARTVGRASFEYQINGENIVAGDMPLFEPGDVNITARLFRNGVEQNSSTHTLTGLKGRPYLKIGFDQNQTVLNLSAELFGIHPNHLLDEGISQSLLSGITFDVSEKRGLEILPGGRVVIDPTFNGFIDIVATFQGDAHYEGTNRSISLLVKNGEATDVGKDGMVTVQVKDLDGWQKNRVVKMGEELMVSASQGFGKNRKFKRWLEFSDESQKLRTARVQEPFAIRTALLAEEDMTLFAHYNFTFVGTAINGYLGGATVFLDYNLNGMLDEGEPSGFSKSNGGFEIEVSEEDIQTHDQNKNGVIDTSEGMLVVLGGTDHSSRLPFAISYRAPPSYSVITAVSTMVAALAEEGLTLSEAENLVSQLIKLPEDIEIADFEPIQKAFSDGEKAKRFVLRATQLSNVINEFSRYIEMRTGGRVDRIKAAGFVVDVLTDRLLSVSQRRSSDGSVTLDLDSSDLLLDVISSVESIAIEEAATTEADEFLEISSLRAELSNLQPEIAEVGNDEVRNEVVDQVATANSSLNELSENPEVSSSEFKVLASASQTVLNDLGQETANSLSQEEVELLSNLAGSEAVDAQSIIAQSSELSDQNNGGGSSAEKFSTDALSDLSAAAGINVYAPTLDVSEIVPPAELNDDLIVGTLSASDPEGGDVSYELIEGNPDYDLDEISMFFIDPISGDIQVLDVDDLKLSTEDAVQIIVRVTDADGLFSDEQVTIKIESWSYLYGRLQIPDLSLSVPENLPAGTIIHRFEEDDVYGGAIQYQLVNGEGDADNENFSIDVQGSLSTARIFDYENDKQELQIRLQATDSKLNTVEKSLEVLVTNIVLPNVPTGGAEMNGSQLQFNASLTFFGSAGDDVTLGFLVSRTPITNISDSSLLKVYSTSDSESAFSGQVAAADGGPYFYIAFAESQEGIKYGLEQSFILPRITAGESWQDGVPIDDFTGWWQSDWFGLFNARKYPWIYHQNLGWLYVYSQSAQGTWLYSQRLGWTWTMPDHFPYLYLFDEGFWTFLDVKLANTTLYDFQEEEWFEANAPIDVTVEVSPQIGGSVYGAGQYYRWDKVRLEAIAADGYNFAGWLGDFTTMEKVIEFDAIDDRRVEASFIRVMSDNVSPQQVISDVQTVLDKMNHLNNAEKERSLAELLIYGTSSTSGLSIKKNK